MAKDKENNMAKEFVNPFASGINYEQFMSAIPKDMSVSDYCKDHLTQDQIIWLEEDLKHYKLNLKNKI